MAEPEDVPGVVVVTMPQMGETVTEGTVTAWLKNVGDAVVDLSLIHIWDQGPFA